MPSEPSPLDRAYPSDWSHFERVFRPLVDWRVYLRTAYLLAMFPLGIAYFVVFVTLFAVGGAFAITLAGPPILVLTMYLSRWCGDFEAWLVRRAARIELRRPPTAIERTDLRGQIKQRALDPTTWTGVLYLFGQFPIGIAAFVVLVVSTTLALTALLVTPWLALGGEALDVSLGSWTRIYDSQTETWPFMFLGVAWLLAQAHLVNLASVLHARWARLMLGSRARRIANVAAPHPPATPEDGALDSSGPDNGGPKGGSSPSVGPRSGPESALTSDAPRSTRPGETVPSALATLTPRELEVLRLIAQGYSNAEIAEAFVISEGTVKTHVKRILAKQAARDRTQLAVLAYETGFVRPGALEEAAAIEEARRLMTLGH